MRLKIALFLIALSSSLIGKSPHLILHFDVNQTLIPTDPSGMKSCNDVLIQALARECIDRWDDEHPPMSYYRYVYEVLFPGHRSDIPLKKKKIAALSNFLNVLEERNHPFYPEAMRRYHLAKEIVNSSKRLVVSSFYKLLDFLEEQPLTYTIVLRSFGHDLDRVKAEIEAYTPLCFSPSKLNYKQGILHQEGSICDHPFKLFVESRALAIQDDWKWWNSHDENGAYGKPMPIDESQALSLFFDDHIEIDQSPKYNIVAPYNLKTGAPLNTYPLTCQHRLARVDTLAAIIDPAYYTTLVKQALYLKSFRPVEEEESRSQKLGITQ